MLVKKMLAAGLIVMLALTAAACGGNKSKLVGTWQAVDNETATEYGVGLEFKKDGTFSYGLTEELISSLSDLSDKEAEEAMAGMDMLLKMEYKVKSDTVMEIKASALFGLASEKTDVEYSLNGDELVFDGVQYKRVK